MANIKIRGTKFLPKLAVAFVFGFLTFYFKGYGLIDGADALETIYQSNSTSAIYLPLVSKPQEVNWAMAGANAERTSWVAEEVRGNLKPLWYRPIEPYILPRVQIVAADESLFISTARGLYALSAITGEEKWVYPTELPLGHSPTISGGVAYVGGFDRRLHAVNASNGEGLWKFEAGAGFDTNPLVVGDKVYAGNRDGYFYAIYARGANAGQLAWKYQTDGPIHYSAAYKSGIIYFASDDSHAYALNAQNGQLVWKSVKLPGAGFHSWWPVIYGDYVVFSGGSNYTNHSKLGIGSLRNLDLQEIYVNHKLDPKGTLIGPLESEPGNWISGTPTIDTSRATSTSNGSTKPITEYFEEKPWRRTYFVLNRLTGQEYISDFDLDGRPEYAPILWFGTHGGGNRFPPIVGGDGVIYQTNNYMSSPFIAGGQVSGWKVGTPHISVISSDWGAVDEPHAYAGGGDLIYWNLCCDRQFGVIDLSIPNQKFADAYNAGERPPTSFDQNRERIFFGYDLPELVPGYNVMTYSWDPYSKPYGGVYGGRNGSYGWHGDENPPIPYDGKVFMHRSNAVIAFAPNVQELVSLPLVRTVNVQEDLPPLSVDELRSALMSEIQIILDSGHLRPGYMSSGLFDLNSMACGDNLVEYWHHSGDIIYTLIRALPHLPSDLQAETKAYIQKEMVDYPPHEFNHIGWAKGADRDVFTIPLEIEAVMSNSNPQKNNLNFEGWELTPNTFYVLWKYAQVFPDQVADIFAQSHSKLEIPPPDHILLEMPHVHNAYIAGYVGYLELEQLAGYSQSAQVKAELDRLLALRGSHFSKDPPDVYFTDPNKYYCRGLNASRNFMYLVPELAQYFREKVFSQVREAITEFENTAPYWFVSRAEVAFAEAVITPYYDYNALFQAKSLILQQPFSELSKYMDVPAFPVGDLFYIQNLISLIESSQAFQEGRSLKSDSTDFLLLKVISVSGN